MLTIYGNSFRFCDGISRRNFLRIGALGLGGLALPQLLQAESQSGIRKSHKAIIMIYLPGGPPHQDMFDLKMDAPAEIRGEFKPISTNVPGFQICELLPGMAQMADKLAIIRSIVGSEGRHASFQCMTGWTVNGQPAGGWPSLGAVVSKLEGPVEPGTLPFISLSPHMKTSTWSDPGQAGFLGQAHAPFAPNAEKTDLE